MSSQILPDLTAPGGGSYVLPPATASTLGGIKVGAGLVVALDGLLTTALPTLVKQIITTSGTWTAPADGVVFLILVGGGGVGGRGGDGGIVRFAGGGGGGGGIRFALWTVAANDTIVISIGAAGNATTPNGGATTAAYGGETATAGGGECGATGANPLGGPGGAGDLAGADGGTGEGYPKSAGGTAVGGVGGWPNGGRGGNYGVSTVDPADGGDGYAILFFAARPAAQ